jgi:hypothetical protein
MSTTTLPQKHTSVQLLATSKSTTANGAGEGGVAGVAIGDVEQGTQGRARAGSEPSESREAGLPPRGSRGLGAASLQRTEATS